MQKIFASTTDTILFLLALALIAFTALKITDPKDFIAFVGMVASYKFGRTQGQVTDAPLIKTVDVQG